MWETPGGKQDGGGAAVPSLWGRGAQASEDTQSWATGSAREGKGPAVTVRETNKTCGIGY